MAGLMDSNKIISGSFVKIFYEGEWLNNAESAEISLDVEKVEVKRAGTRSTGTKIVGYKGVGSISGFKVNSVFLERLSIIQDDNAKPFITELIFTASDPESDGQVLRVRVKDVSFDKVDLLKYSVGDLVREELPFTFTKYEILEGIR